MAAVAKQERRSSSVNRDAALRYSLRVLMSASTPASSSLPLCGSMWLASPSWFFNLKNGRNSFVRTSQSYTVILTEFEPMSTMPSSIRACLPGRFILCR